MLVYFVSLFLTKNSRLCLQNEASLKCLTLSKSTPQFYSHPTGNRGTAPVLRSAINILYILGMHFGADFHAVVIQTALKI
jgi:hypothetical protein